MSHKGQITPDAQVFSLRYDTVLVNPGSTSRRNAALVCCNCSLSKVKPEILEAVPWKGLVSSGCVLCCTGWMLCCLEVLWSLLTWMSLFSALCTRWSLGASWRNNFHMQTWLTNGTSYFLPIKCVDLFKLRIWLLALFCSFLFPPCITIFLFIL